MFSVIFGWIHPLKRLHQKNLLTLLSSSFVKDPPCIATLTPHLTHHHQPSLQGTSGFPAGPTEGAGPRKKVTHLYRNLDTYHVWIQTFQGNSFYLWFGHFSGRDLFWIASLILHTTLSSSLQCIPNSLLDTTSPASHARNCRLPCRIYTRNWTTR